MYRTSCENRPSERLFGHAGSICRSITHLFGLDPLVLGQRLVKDRLLDGGPESEGSVVRLFRCKSADSLQEKSRSLVK